jgi:hypothetical protein
VAILRSGSSLLRIGGGGGVLRVADGGGGGEGYDLDDAIAGDPFTINKPTAPTITSNVSVTTATIAANKVNGRQITLAAGDYGTQNFSTTDQEIILQAGAILGDVTFGSGAARIEIHGETVRVGQIGSIDVDGLASDINIYETTFADGVENIIYGDRCAIWSCLIRMDGRYCAYIDSCSDFIFANNDAEITGSVSAPGVRYMGVERSVTVDNRIAVAGQQCLRYHADPADSTDHYASRNQLEGPPGQMQANSGGGGYERLINVTYTSNTIYDLEFSNYGSMGTGDQRCEVLTMTGNTMYSNGGAFPSELLPAWDISSNTVNAYTAPPAWDFQ